MGKCGNRIGRPNFAGLPGPKIRTWDTQTFGMVRLAPRLKWCPETKLDSLWSFPIAYRPKTAPKWEAERFPQK
jgi:hypothetical protein